MSQKSDKHITLKKDVTTILTGLHLAKGEGGAKACVNVHKHMYTKGVWGHAVLENFRF